MALTETIFPLEGKRVWVAGHAGMVGAAIARRLEIEGCQIITVDRGALDLRDQTAVRKWVASEKPQAIFLAAARVGGILENNNYPANFLYDNLMIEGNVINAAYELNVSKLLFLGSSCIYPKFAPQPIREDALLTGPLEPTNQWYAIAKIAGIKLCQAYRVQHGSDFISVMPTNLYGPGDNFDLKSSHVIPALLRKAHDAKAQNESSLVIWGSGTPLREFLYVDDCADACVHLMKNYSELGHVNVGSGDELSIADLAKMICRVVKFDGHLVYDSSMPDGTPRKLMDSRLLRGTGWKPMVGLEAGLAETYRWFLNRSADR